MGLWRSKSTSIMQRSRMFNRGHLETRRKPEPFFAVRSFDYVFSECAQCIVSRVTDIHLGNVVIPGR